MAENSENPFGISTSSNDDLAGSCQIDLNDSGTCEKIDPPLTQARSGFDLENTRRDLIAKRVAVGANTPIGHRCSNLIEQLDAYRTAEGDQRANLAKSIRRTMADFDAFQ